MTAVSTYRAFLSHSSENKDLVRAVANELGRPFVRIDYQAFSTGDELVNAIGRAFEASALFVLFASKAALRSMWVNFETREAQMATAFGRIPAPLVYIVDKTVRVSDLPGWMQRAKVTSSTSPRLIAADLRVAIDDLVIDRQQDIYVGRAREARELEEYLAPTDGSRPPQVFSVTGLVGIGRRTLTARVSRDVLSFRHLLTIEAESGDSSRDLASKIADLVEPVGGVQQSIDRFAEIQRGTDESAIERAVEDLAAAISIGMLPVVIDSGGMLQNDGRLSAPMQELVREVSNTRDVYMALVANRRPVASGLTAHPAFPNVQVRPLSDPELRRLVSAIARRVELELTANQVSDLAIQCRGYPPAARYAIELVRHYGAPAVLADTEQLIQFRSSPMVRYLRQVASQPVHQRILQILAANSPLPLDVLAKFADASEATLAQTLIELIDLALVVPDNAGWYRISAPVTDAVGREYRDPSPTVFSQVAARLEEFLRRQGQGIRYAELERVRYRALAMAGTYSAGQAQVGMVADWIRLAERLYHDREYTRCVEFARLAVDARPDNESCHRWVISGLIKLGEFPEASEAIEDMYRYGFRRETLYLEGFLERHLGHHSRAAQLFEDALRQGYSGAAIHRELANCYLELGRVDEARGHIEIAQERSRDNPFLIDLLIRIACMQRDEATAITLLKALAEVDDPHFVAHRSSRVAALFGRFEEAYAHACAAIADSGRPSHEALCNLTYCCIRTRRYALAEETLQKVDRYYPKRELDVRIGLRCRLAIVQDRFEEALSTWERLDDKSRPVHLRLKRDAMKGLLRDRAQSDETYKALKDEIEELETRLGSVADDETATELGVR